MAKGKLAEMFPAGSEDIMAGQNIYLDAAGLAEEERRREEEKARANSGRVKRGFTPEAFTWYDDLPDRFTKAEMAVVISKHEIRVLSAAGRKIQEVVEPGPDGYYRVAVGIAPKAIAIRPLPPGKKGLRVRREKKSGAMYISCTKLIAKLNWPLPVRMLAVWDEEHQMLVAVLPEVHKR